MVWSRAVGSTAPTHRLAPDSRFTSSELVPATKIGVLRLGHPVYSSTTHAQRSPWQAILLMTSLRDPCFPQEQEARPLPKPAAPTENPAPKGKYVKLVKVILRYKVGKGFHCTARGAPGGNQRHCKEYERFLHCASVGLGVLTSGQMEVLWRFWVVPRRALVKHEVVAIQKAWLYRTAGSMHAQPAACPAVGPPTLVARG